MFIGAGAYAGHMLQRPLMATWGGAIDTKTYTAIGLVLCGSAAVACAADRFERGWKLTLAVTSAMMAGWLAAVATWAYLAIGPMAERPADAGMPSIATMACLFLFAAAMVYRARMTDTNGRCTYSRVAGWIILLIAGTALLGHWLRDPTFYWYIAEQSNGMAIPTATTFIALGSALIALPSTRSRA